jgi:hypothetical protein
MLHKAKVRAEEQRTANAPRIAAEKEIQAAAAGAEREEQATAAVHQATLFSQLLKDNIDSALSSEIGRPKPRGKPRRSKKSLSSLQYWRGN